MFNILIDGEVRAIAWSRFDAANIAADFRERLKILADMLGEYHEVKIVAA